MRDSLSAEAVLVARAQDTNPRTIAKYELHLGHFANYLASARRQSLLTAGPQGRRHVPRPPVRAGRRAAAPGPQGVRLVRAARLPDGRTDPGWSASTNKGYLAAIRFLYRHCP